MTPRLRSALQLLAALTLAGLALVTVIALVSVVDGVVETGEGQ